MAKAKQSATELALSRLRKRRPTAWHLNVDPKHLPVMNELADAYFSGKLGPHAKTAAEAISETLKELGIADVKFQGVLEWLRRTRKA